MKANSEKTKQSNKATRRVLAGVLCGASVLSLVLSLVMPPISQAIANDDQTEETVTGDFSTESTDLKVKNTNNEDAENQISDETEGDEFGDDAQLEGQSEEGQQNEGTTTSDGETVAAAAENGQAKTAAAKIETAKELSDRLQSVQAGATANFILAADIDTSTTIQLDEDGSNITLDLNGYKIKYSNKDQPLFNITKGATLTVKDNKQTVMGIPTDDSFVCQDNSLSKNGNPAFMTYDTSNIPTNLTYYVTGSSVKADGTSTTETLYKHETSIGGAIVACADKDNLNHDYLKLINLYAADNKGGTFNLESGVITQQNNISVNSLVYAEEGSIVNMSGGYVCGATSKSQGAGIELGVKNGKGATLNLTGGVIAGNCAPRGGGVYANGVDVNPKDSENNMTKINMLGGVISGNSTPNVGLGGGIMAVGGIVSVSGGYITNNRMAQFCGEDGSGNHGGGGLAANNGAHVTISGGQITGNYSEEAGGGVYVTDVERNNQSRTGMAWLNITGGIIASNVSNRSEGAGVRVGQMVDAMISGTTSKVYITNNHCMSRFDWGGGGIFVQGNSNEGKEKTAGRLFVYNSYISSNTAGGYGGGVAVCPTGKTLVTNTEGTAIFGNTDAGKACGYDKNKYDKSNNSGNEGSPHLSGGGSGKTEDHVAYNSVDVNNEHVFRDSGHADFFLAASGHTTPVAVVTGKMLGDIDAKYSGSIELTNRITIPANGAVQVKNSIGLTSDVKATDQAVTDAVQGKVQGTKVTTFITGNYSWDHGGGIMSNGDLYLGVPADAYVYPSLKLKATKKLDGRTLGDGEFKFTVYRKGSDARAPSWKNNVFDDGGCEFVESAPNDADGNIAFDLSNDLSKQLGDFSKKLSSNTGKITYSYYLVEDAGNIPGVDYDQAVYEINVTVEYNKTVLMSVPIQGKLNDSRDLNVYNYTIDRVDVTKNPGGSADPLGSVSPTDDYYSIADSGEGSTFTNKYTPSVSWTPKATKVVEGGEMKEFTLQLATDSEFQNIIGTAVTSGNNKEQTLSFKDVTDKDKTIELKYSLSDITANPDTAGDSSGRGASKTFYYYVCEKNESSAHPHYKFDPSVYRFKVVATDDTEGHIDCQVTYRRGTVDSDGKWNDADDADHKLTDTDNPTFTNTYSTSLPLSGMSGVTLTYLAGAAVLCAAAAWMHIRRKANAKGGERRE